MAHLAHLFRVIRGLRFELLSLKLLYVLLLEQAQVDSGQKFVKISE